MVIGAVQFRAYLIQLLHMATNLGWMDDRLMKQRLVQSEGIVDKNEIRLYWDVHSLLLDELAQE